MVSKNKISSRDRDNMQRLQETVPVLVMSLEGTRKRWWFFKGEFYCDDEGYDEGTVKVLALAILSKKEKRVKRARTLLESVSDIVSDSRGMIPDEVKIFVWKRDNGSCVKCGNKEKLEFDHIIPFSQGGSSTGRNLQLLCEECNRSKGNSLI